MTPYRKIALIGAVAVLVAAGLLRGVWKADGAETERTGQSSATPVETARVTTGSLTSSVSAVGTVEARRDVVVSSEAAGRVIRVLVDVGDRVTPGTVLVELESELRRLAVDQAEAQFALARANAEKAERDLERNRTLHAKGDVSDAEMEGIRLAAQSAASAHRSADAALKVARRQLADTQIRSPIAGTVAKRFAEVGETVGPGSPVFNVVDLDVVRVKLTLPESEIGGVATGQRARVSVDRYPDLEGSVAQVGSKSEGNSHRYPVEVEVANREGDPLKAGMFARTEIVTGTRERIPLIPTAALVGGDGPPSVYVIQEGRARLRAVSPAGRRGDTTGVADGLREGEVVVTMGQQALKDGAAVEVK
jgi:RND family efflux transporter MFP subunit